MDERMNVILDEEERALVATSNPETIPQPSLEELIDWESRGYCEAEDGCRVEPDGTCEHGYQSWLVLLGYI